MDDRQARDLPVLEAEPERPQQDRHLAVNGACRRPLRLTPDDVARDEGRGELAGPEAAEGPIEMRDPPAGLLEVARAGGRVVGDQAVAELGVRDTRRAHHERLVQLYPRRLIAEQLARDPLVVGTRAHPHDVAVLVELSHQVRPHW